MSLSGVDNEKEASSSSAAQDVSYLRILPNINDMSELSKKEPCESSCNGRASVVHDVSTGGDVGFHQSCHKQDLCSHDDASADTISPPQQKLPLLFCGANLANVDSVTVADIHVADTSPQEKLLPSLCDTNATNDGCDGLADISAADSQPQGKLLPSLSAID